MGPVNKQNVSTSICDLLKLSESYYNLQGDELNSDIAGSSKYNQVWINIGTISRG